MIKIIDGTNILNPMSGLPLLDIIQDTNTVIQVTSSMKINMQRFIKTIAENELIDIIAINAEAIRKYNRFLNTNLRIDLELYNQIFTTEIIFNYLRKASTVRFQDSNLKGTLGKLTLVASEIFELNANYVNLTEEQRKLSLQTLLNQKNTIDDYKSLINTKEAELL